MTTFMTTILQTFMHQSLLHDAKSKQVSLSGVGQQWQWDLIRLSWKDSTSSVVCGGNALWAKISSRVCINCLKLLYSTIDHGIKEIQTLEDVFFFLGRWMELRALRDEVSGRRRNCSYVFKRHCAQLGNILVMGLIVLVNFQLEQFLSLSHSEGQCWQRRTAPRSRRV